MWSTYCTFQLVGRQQIKSLPKLKLALDRGWKQCCKLFNFFLLQNLPTTPTLVPLIHHCDRCRDLQQILPPDPKCSGAQWIACKVNGSDPIFPCCTLHPFLSHTRACTHTHTHAKTPNTHSLNPTYLPGPCISYLGASSRCALSFMSLNHSSFKTVNSKTIKRWTVVL